MWLLIPMTRLVFEINLQVLELRKVFANNWSANIKLSKTHPSKILHYCTDSTQEDF